MDFGVKEKLSIEELRSEISERREKLRAAQNGNPDYKDDTHLLGVTDEEIAKIDDGDAEMMETIRDISSGEELMEVRKKLDDFIAASDGSKPDVNAVIIKEFIRKMAEYGEN